MHYFMFVKAIEASKDSCFFQSPFVLPSGYFYEYYYLFAIAVHRERGIFLHKKTDPNSSNHCWKRQCTLPGRDICSLWMSELLPWAGLTLTSYALISKGLSVFMTNGNYHRAFPNPNLLFSVVASVFEQPWQGHPCNWHHLRSPPEENFLTYNQARKGSIAK